VKTLCFGMVASVLLLAGCVSDEEAARQRLANYQRSCKTMGYTPRTTEYANCLQSMAIVTQQIRAEREERAEAAGQALQNAGAALSGINPTPPMPAPPTTIRCQTFGNQTTCNQF
jgi:hypothetical protein